MYAVTSTALVSFTRATFRSAEFGFFGVVVYTRVHTPRRCGLPLRAAVLTLAILSRRPLRTSWLMVGMYRLSVLLLLVFGCSQVCVLRVSLVRVPRDRACRTRPRTDVLSMHRGHANWPGVQACLRKPLSRKRLGQARWTTIPAHGRAGQSASDQPLRAAAQRLSMPGARRSTMSLNTASVSTSSITPVISSRTNPCSADQNSSAA